MPSVDKICSKWNGARKFRNGARKNGNGARKRRNGARKSLQMSLYLLSKLTPKDLKRLIRDILKTLNNISFCG